MTPNDVRAETAAVWAMRLDEGVLTPDEQTALEDWLDADPANGAELEEIVAAWRAVDDYAASEPMMALREEALASARRSMRSNRADWTRRRPAWLAIAASIVLLIGLGLGTWYLQSPTTYSTGVGERRVVALDDGSKLSLDAATSVRVKYGREGRRLWLDRGRAKFSVAKDPLRPFSVAAEGSLVVATGTEFSVERIGRQVRVLLFEGQVAVMRDRADALTDVVFTPVTKIPAARLPRIGQELVLTEPATPDRPVEATVMARADPVRAASWEAGLLVFENETLDVVAARTNRYATRPLVLTDPVVGSLRISGVFRGGDTDTLVEGLQAALGVRARSNGGTIDLRAPAARLHEAD